MNGKHHTGKTCKMVKIKWESKTVCMCEIGNEVASGSGENEDRQLWRGEEIDEQRRFPAPTNTNTHNWMQTIEKEKHK